MLKKFPDIHTLGWKSTKSQKWNTVVKKSGSGKVRTMTTWDYPEWTITTHFAYLTYEDYKQITGFFAGLKGALNPFLWKDPEDYHENGIQLGFGNVSSWQALRKVGEYIEPVEYVENVTLYKNGVEIPSTVVQGVISTTSTVTEKDVITADYDYYWKVMLKDDGFSVEMLFDDVYKSKSMKLVTVR